MSSSDLRSLGAHVADRQDALIEAAAPSEATRRMLAERAASRVAPKPLRRFVPVATAALIGIAAGLAVSFGALVKAEPLHFTVGDAARPGVVRAWESAPADGKLPIRFSDGSEVRLEPKARAQVARVAETGAEVLIESGSALVDVVPREGGSWRVRSGPFTTIVKGTRFEVSYDPTADEFALHLFEGRVLVTGCALGAGRTVEQGESLRASCRPQQAPATAAPALPQAATSPAAIVSNPVPMAEGPKPSPGVAPAAAGETSSWQDLARGGYYQRAYELVVRSGFEAECQRASAEDTLMLGDAARLSGRSEHARLAYTSVRSRFAGSDAAARAAFALGRLAFDAGNPSAAIPWFDTYLAQSPSGPLALPALDRLLEATLRLGDKERARQVAKIYVARNPSGPHAKDAQRILGEAKD
jgi:TolA-binding protein